MFKIVVKNRGELYERLSGMSLANAILSAEDLVYDYITFLQGAGHNYEIFLPNHPMSTINNPTYYCLIDGLTNTYRIYKHTKIIGWLSSEHVYEKIMTIKLLRTDRPFVNDKKNMMSYEYIEKWQEVTKELLQPNNLANMDSSM